MLFRSDRHAAESASYRRDRCAFLSGEGCLVNRTGISASNRPGAGAGITGLVSRAVVVEPVHIELVVVAGTSLG